MKDFFRSKVFIAYLAVLFLMFVFPPYVGTKSMKGVPYVAERGYAFILDMPVKKHSGYVNYSVNATALSLQVIAASIFSLLVYIATGRRRQKGVAEGDSLAGGGEDGRLSQWEDWSKTEAAKLYRLAIGDKGSDYYLSSFFELEKTGSYRYAFSWNWAAFIFSWMWLLYRKMYLGCGAFVLALPAIAYLLSIADALWGEALLLSWLFLSVILGLFGNSLYLFQTRSCVKWAQRARDTEEGVEQYLQSRGGASVRPVLALFVATLSVASCAILEGKLKGKRKVKISFNKQESSLPAEAKLTAGASTTGGLESTFYGDLDLDDLLRLEWKPSCKEWIGFDFTAALSEGYSHKQIIDYLSTKYECLDVQGARKAGLTDKQIVTYYHYLYN